MTKNKYDVVIIGGGPAGIAAATTAAKNNQASVLIIDASESLGGNYYKPLPTAFRASHLKYNDNKRQNALQKNLQTLSQTTVDVMSGTRIWGVFREGEHFNLCLDSSGEIEVKSLIIATGVYDRSIPFPGWTLSGVMTPGAVQMLIEKQGIVPGKRAIVAGSGPLQLAVATTLAEVGVDVVALLDTSGVTDGLRQMPMSMWGQWAKAREFSSYVFSLLRKRVPVRFRHTVFKAIGTLQDGVQQAIIGKVDADGHPNAGTEQTLDVDLVCVAYGFMPSIAMTLHLGCAHEYHEQLGAYVPSHNEYMQTSLERVFVAGDMTGVGGKTLAELQGQVAGISAVESLGLIDKQQAENVRSQLRVSIERENRFAKWMWGRWRMKPGFWDMADDETVICRCESVTTSDIFKGCTHGARNLQGIKLRTRLGMGICQGRYCVTNASILMAKELGCYVQDIGLHSVRPPVVPVRLGAIAEDSNL